MWSAADGLALGSTFAHSIANASSKQTAGAEADLDSMSITVTTKGTKLLAMFSMDVEFGGGTSYGYCLLQVDASTKNRSDFGSDSGTTQIGTSGVSGGCSTTVNWLATTLTPGSHTVKIRWSGGGGYGVFGYYRTLIVIDLP